MPYLDIKKSTAKNKKWTAIFYDHNHNKVKTIQFGDNRYQDYTQHKNEERKRKYISRHSNENHNNPMTAGSLSRYVLWEKPTLTEGIRFFKNKFGYKSYGRADY
jgi:hypothetical protein